MQKIKIDDEIYENLLKVGDGDVNKALIVLWEVTKVFREVVDKAGLLSPPLIREIEIRVALRQMTKRDD